MICDPQFSECDGWFLLSYTKMSNLWDGDLGRGDASCLTRFKTATERQNYIEIEHLRDEIGRLNSELSWIKTVKGANRNLREAREKAKKEKSEMDKYHRQLDRWLKDGAKADEPESAKPKAPKSKVPKSKAPKSKAQSLSKDEYKKWL